MPVDYWNAPELLEMARPIIEKHHPHLVGYPMRVVWRSTAKKRTNKVVLATAEIVSSRFAAFVMTEDERVGSLGQHDGPKMFWIEVAWDTWQTLNDHQRLALIDHELCHFGIVWDDVDGEEEPEMVLFEHDVEEFAAIVKRHGLWKEDLLAFGITVKEALDRESEA